MEKESKSLIKNTMYSTSVPTGICAVVVVLFLLISLSVFKTQIAYAANGTFDSVEYIDELTDVYDKASLKITTLNPDTMQVDYDSSFIYYNPSDSYFNEAISENVFRKCFYRTRDVSYSGTFLTLKFPKAGYAEKLGEYVDIVVKFSNFYKGGGSSAANPNPFVGVTTDTILATCEHNPAYGDLGVQTQVQVDVYAYIAGTDKTALPPNEDGDVQSLVDDSMALVIKDLDQPDWWGGGAWDGYYAESVRLYDSQHHYDDREPEDLTPEELARLLSESSWDWSKVWLKNGTYLNVNQARNGVFLNGRYVFTDQHEDEYSGFGVISKGPHVRYIYRGSSAGTTLLATGGSVSVGNLELNKTSEKSNWDDQLNTYSLEGAVYRVYKNEADAKNRNNNQKFTLKTDANGHASRASITAGKYYVAEIKPSAGHKLDKKIYEVDVPAGGTGTVNSVEPVVYDAYEVIINKSDPSFNPLDPSGDSELVGAQYEIKYYDGYYDSLNDLPKSPKSTVEFATDSKGRLHFKDGTPINGTSWTWTYGSGDSNKVMPLGTYSIREIKSVDGYTINENTYLWKVERTADWLGATSKKVGTWSSKKATDNLLNTLWAIDQPSNWRGSVVLRKVDKDWWDAGDYARAIGPEGDGSFKGAEFTVVNESKHHIRSHGKTIEPGEIVGTCTINDETGVTSFDDLPYGTYSITETKQPFVGYHTNNSWSKTFKIREDGQTVYLVDEPVADPVFRGGLALGKIDATTYENWPEGDASLKNAEFKVYNISKHEIFSKGKTYPTYRTDSGGYSIPDDAVPCATLHTDDKGKASLDVKTLPYGTYIIKEITPPKGYLVNPTFARGVKFSVRSDGEIVDFDTVDENDKPTNYGHKVIVDVDD